MFFLDFCVSFYFNLCVYKMYSVNREITETLPRKYTLIKNKLKTPIIVNIKKINLYIQSRNKDNGENYIYDQYISCDLFLIRKNDRDINRIPYKKLGDYVNFNPKLIINLNYKKYLNMDCNIDVLLYPDDEIYLRQREVFDYVDKDDRDIAYIEMYFDFSRYPN